MPCSKLWNTDGCILVSCPCIVLPLSTNIGHVEFVLRITGGIDAFTLRRYWNMVVFAWTALSSKSTVSQYLRTAGWTALSPRNTVSQYLRTAGLTALSPKSTVSQYRP